MDYTTKIRRELFNDRVFKAMYESVKPEEKAEFDAALNELVKLAGSSVDGFSVNYSKSNISAEDIESAINDRTGRK